MAKYVNKKPGILGFNVKGKNEKGETAYTERTVNPGEVFEAEKGDIPEHFFTNGWFEEAKDIPEGQKSQELPESADRPLNPRLDGPNPTQGSGTSDRQSTTDKDAQKSGTYDNKPARDNTNTDVKGTSGGTNPTSGTTDDSHKRK